MPAKNTTRREPWNPLLKGYPFSEKVNAVSVGAETLFTRLVAQADDYGNYYGNPKQILAYLYGHRFAAGHVTATDTGRWRAELVSNAVGPLAAIYEVNGAEYIHLLNPRRRLREDVKADERFPREPANIQEQATSEHVTRTGRRRAVNGALDLDLDQDADLDLDQEKHLLEKNENEPLEKVLTRLNELRKESWEWTKYNPLTSKHKTNTEHITALLNDGSTADELIIVLEYIAAKNKGHEPSKQYFNCITPFRPKHWENNLAMATDWEAKGRPASKPSGNGSSNGGKRPIDTGGYRHGRESFAESLKCDKVE